MSDEPKIERRTSAGWLELLEDAPLERCASHGDDQPEQVDRTVGIVVVTSQGRKLESAMCGDCIARALALYWGRQHVAAGGEVSELADDPPPNTPDGTPERRACIAAGGHFWPPRAPGAEDGPAECGRCGFNPGWLPGGEDATAGDG